MIFNMVGGGAGASKFPEFTYTGDYQVIDDGVVDKVQNWRVKFLTSGTLTFTKNPGSMDVFLVGGGGGGYASGGGGGYTKTQKGITVELNKPYTIIVGAGGSAGADGGLTSAFSATANGGTSSGSLPAVGNQKNNGAAGGSGGGATAGADGGSDGSDGEAVTSIGAVGGTGQHTTTREFGETTGDLYAGGGGGRYVQGLGNPTPGKGGDGGGGDGSTSTGISGVVNTGGGGGGAPSQDGSGGSGIVIIRNSRG